MILQTFRIDSLNPIKHMHNPETLVKNCCLFSLKSPQKCQYKSPPKPQTCLLQLKSKEKVSLRNCRSPQSKTQFYGQSKKQKHRRKRDASKEGSIIDKLETDIKVLELNSKEYVQKNKSNVYLHESNKVKDNSLGVEFCLESANGCHVNRVKSLNSRPTAILNSNFLSTTPIEERMKLLKRTMNSQMSTEMNSPSTMSSMFAETDGETVQIKGKPTGQFQRYSHFFESNVTFMRPEAELRRDPVQSPISNFNLLSVENWNDQLKARSIVSIHEGSQASKFGSQCGVHESFVMDRHEKTENVTHLI